MVTSSILFKHKCLLFFVAVKVADSFLCVCLKVKDVSDDFFYYLFDAIIIHLMRFQNVRLVDLDVVFERELLLLTDLTASTAA